jgi:hypothetical protein
MTDSTPRSPAPSRSPHDARNPFSLEELLELLVERGVLLEEQARDVAARAVTLRSAVLRDRCGSVRSQAAARYEVSPAEIVAAAELPVASDSRQRVSEDVIAAALAEASGLAYLKIDPLRLDGELITRTWARRGRGCVSRSPTPSTAPCASPSRPCCRSRSPTWWRRSATS